MLEYYVDQIFTHHILHNIFIYNILQLVFSFLVVFSFRKDILNYHFHFLHTRGQLFTDNVLYFPFGMESWNTILTRYSLISLQWIASVHVQICIYKYCTVFQPSFIGLLDELVFCHSLVFAASSVYFVFKYCIILYSVQTVQTVQMFTP